MNAVGIDVSSRKSTVAVLRPLGEVVCLPFDVSHDADGLASLAEKLKAIDGETRVVIIGLICAISPPWMQFATISKPSTASFSLPLSSGRPLLII